MELKDVLKSLLEEYKLSPRDFATELGIDHSSVYLYLRGGYPNVDNAVKISNYFDCSLNYLFGLDIEPKETNFFDSYDATIFISRYLELLNQKNIKHFALTKLIGLNQSSYWLWKKGSIPKTDSLYKIANYFNVTMDYLIGRSDE